MAMTKKVSHEHANTKVWEELLCVICVTTVLKTFSNICDKDDAIGRKQDVTNMTALINDLVFL